MEEREIKFRAKVKYNGLGYFSGDWIEGCLNYNLSPHTVENVMVEAWIREPLRNLSTPIEIDVKTIGQYTGLKDKNGKEVCEGDVLVNKKSRKGNFFVKFNVGGYDAVYKGNFTLCLHPVLLELMGCEIIGNIHENPELIK